MIHPPLLIVTLLFRSRPRLEALPHVVESVSIFLDASVELPLSKACKFGSLTLLNRIWDSLNTVDTESDTWPRRKLLLVHSHYRTRQSRLALVETAKIRSLEITKWLFGKFPNRPVDMFVIEEVAAAGAMNVLRFYYDNDLYNEARNGEHCRHVTWGGKDDGGRPRRHG